MYQANQPVRAQDPAPRNANAPGQGSDPSNGIDFAQTLAEAQGIHFSNHAQKRLQKRDIQLSDDSVNRLADAVNKVEKRGGKSSLVLVDDLAFIVNVQQRMVVTAMDTKERGEGVYNQIDSVVFAAPAEAQDVRSAPDASKKNGNA